MKKFREKIILLDPVEYVQEFYTFMSKTQFYILNFFGFRYPEKCVHIHFLMEKELKSSYTWKSVCNGL